MFSVFGLSRFKNEEYTLFSVFGLSRFKNEEYALCLACLGYHALRKKNIHCV